MTITWTIDALKTKPTDNGNADVVCEAGWRATIVDGELSDSAYGSVAIPFGGGKFTPYDKLTQEQVLGWIGDLVEKEEIETLLKNRMAELKAPKIEKKPIPWSA